MITAKRHEISRRPMRNAQKWLIIELALQTRDCKVLRSKLFLILELTWRYKTQIFECLIEPNRRLTKNTSINSIQSIFCTLCIVPDGETDN